MELVLTLLTKVLNVDAPVTVKIVITDLYFLLETKKIFERKFERNPFMIEENNSWNVRKSYAGAGLRI